MDEQRNLGGRVEIDDRWCGMIYNSRGEPWVERKAWDDTLGWNYKWKSKETHVEGCWMAEGRWKERWRCGMTDRRRGRKVEEE